MQKSIYPDDEITSSVTIDETRDAICNYVHRTADQLFCEPVRRLAERARHGDSGAREALLVLDELVLDSINQMLRRQHNANS